MPNVLIFGFSGEGDTDRRFLGPLLQRTFEDLLLEADGLIDCFPPNWLGVAKSKEIAVTAVKAGENKLMLYCTHVDEDGDGYATTHQNQLQPSLTILEAGTASYPPIIPVFPKEETESWMLADTDTLKNTMNTKLTNAQLGLHGNPENYTDPKQKLIEVIRIVNAEKDRYLPIQIGELYDPLGNDVSLAILGNLASYQRFREAARAGLVDVGYLQ